MLSTHKPSTGRNAAPSQAGSLPARDVHREQVWAAVIRALDFLLDEALERVEDELNCAQRNGDEEATDRLVGRVRVLKELRREVMSPPP